MCLVILLFLAVLQRFYLFAYNCEYGTTLAGIVQPFDWLGALPSAFVHSRFVPACKTLSQIITLMLSPGSEMYMLI